MRADAHPPALLALAPPPLVRAGRCPPPALLACASSCAGAGRCPPPPHSLHLLAPLALVRAEARPRRVPFSSICCRDGRHRYQDTSVSSSWPTFNTLDQPRAQQHHLEICLSSPLRCVMGEFIYKQTRGLRDVQREERGAHMRASADRNVQVCVGTVQCRHCAAALWQRNCACRPPRFFVIYDLQQFPLASSRFGRDSIQ